jgi:hypothetical protein
LRSYLNRALISGYLISIIGIYYWVRTKIKRHFKRLEDFLENVEKFGNAMHLFRETCKATVKISFYISITFDQNNLLEKKLIWLRYMLKYLRENI